MIIVNGVWYIEALPTCAVAELEEGKLAKFYIVPFRELSESDFTDYKGYNPRKCKGQPLPDYLYRFYGLKKNDESMTETVRARVRPSEKSAFIALANGKTESEFLREVVLEKIREGRADDTEEDL